MIFDDLNPSFSAVMLVYKVAIYIFDRINHDATQYQMPHRQSAAAIEVADYNPIGLMKSVR